MENPQIDDIFINEISALAFFPKIKENDVQNSSNESCCNIIDPK